MQCVPWEHNSIIHFEFLNSNQTLTVDLQSQQLQYVHENLSKRSHLSREETLCFSTITQGPRIRKNHAGVTQLP